MPVQSYGNKNNNKVKLFSSAHLKIIAVICMFIDHVGAAFTLNEVWYNAVLHIFEGTSAVGNNFVIYNSFNFAILVMRTVGRISFPIFCFLIVQGFMHTKSLTGYIIRLAVFAIISEIPFNITVAGSMFSLKYQNVFFTLLLGLVAVCAYKYLNVPTILKIILVVFIAVFATIINADYGFFGVITIFLFYVLATNKYYVQLMAVWLLCGSYFVNVAIMYFGGLSLMQSAQINADTGILQGVCAVSLLLIANYSGKKGHHLPKYLFYVFYPVHLLLIFFTGLLILNFIS